MDCRRFDTQAATGRRDRTKVLVERAGGPCGVGTAATTVGGEGACRVGRRGAKQPGSVIERPSGRSTPAPVVGRGDVMEKIAWLVLGVVVLVAALRADRSARARRVGEVAFAALFIGAGALVNTYYLLTGYAFEDFADGAHFAFVRDTWRVVVVPQATVWIGLLIAFEVTVGLLVLSGGRRAEVGLVAVIAMHLALPVFGWITTVWALVMLVAFGLLLRAEHHAAARKRAAVERPAHTPVT